MITEKLFGNHLKLAIREDRIGIVEICRPEKRNALSLEMWQRLADAFDFIAIAPDIVCVVLIGQGGQFCSGADISEFATTRFDSQSAAFYEAENERATIAIRDCPKPVIAAMSGAAVGGGLGLALACDFRVADDSLKTGIPAARLGIIYSIFDCCLIAARIGSTAAKEVLFSGDLFGLSDAIRLGLVDHLAVAPQTVLDAAIALASKFTSRGPLTIRGHKAILNAIESGTLKSQRAVIESAIAQAFDSEDYREGRAAFAERRTPKFIGK